MSPLSSDTLFVIQLRTRLDTLLEFARPIAGEDKRGIPANDTVSNAQGQRIRRVVATRDEILDEVRAYLGRVRQGR